MTKPWQGEGSATLIGSVPCKDHQTAVELALAATPEIPTWPQLTVYEAEQMMNQFNEGLPGLRSLKGRSFIDTLDASFEGEYLEFYEEYLAISQGDRPLESSRFAFGPETGRAFYLFMEILKERRPPCRALKGQVIGPFTLLSGIQDQEGRAILYDDRLQEAGVKLLAMKAKWQAETMGSLGLPTIIFIDEPALAGFGSSAFIGVSAEMIQGMLAEVTAAIHEAGGLAGIHICANTDWAIVFESDIDILNFDAYGYFDRFALYREGFNRFLSRGKTVAWGMVPTSDPDLLHKESVESLTSRWTDQIRELCSQGLPVEMVLDHSLFTPSCGCGSLKPADADRVFELTRSLSSRLREINQM